MKRIISLATSLVAVSALASPAMAAGAGQVQVKVLGSAVLPDGEITDVETDLVGLPSTIDTEANDNVVPTLAVEYFVTDNLSVETICCLTQHDVDGTSGLPGAELVSDAKILPATLTLKYHLGKDGGINPYVGAGPTYFIFIDEKPGAAAVALGADGFRLNDKFGVAFQAGVDVPLGNGFGVTLDAKKYLLRTSAHWFVGDTEVITTRHRLDPWVLSAGVGFTF